jgi:zinc D-Ala-D-Ala dipeptidase
MPRIVVSTPADAPISQRVHGGKVKIGSPEPIAALNRVRILEYALPISEREPLVDVRSYCPHIVASPKLCPYLRKSVADMLNVACETLPEGYQFHVHTCLRTLAMQKRGWDNYFKRKREEHPDWPLSTLRRSVNQYYAPYDQPAPPGHCTGGAVDVAIHDHEGNALDVISPTTGWQAAYTWSDKISAEAKTNRMHMVNAMLGAGFSNCRDEYWHYSYGDSAWAVRVGEKECPYGWIHPPVTADVEFEGSAGSIEAVAFETDAVTGAAHTAQITLAAAQHLNARINWVSGVKCKIEILGSAGLALPDTFHLGPEGENSSPVAPVYWSRDRAVLEIVPDCDRMLVSAATFCAPVTEQ